MLIYKKDGKQFAKFSHKEWINIGKKAKWLKKIGKRKSSTTTQAPDFLQGVRALVNVGDFQGAYDAAAIMIDQLRRSYNNEALGNNLLIVLDRNVDHPQNSDEELTMKEIYKAIDRFKSEFSRMAN